MQANLLNTRTLNYLDLIGNGKLYEVPPYQRDYSWEQDQWEDLWQDIAELRNEDNKSHYLGAIVVEALSDRDFRIIDGQQRLATLSLIALAVIQKLESLASSGVKPVENQERARGLRSRFIGEKDPASLLEHSKLSLNETDNGLFQDYLIQGRKPANQSRLPKSNQLLVKAFDYFTEKLNDIPEFSQDGMALASLLSETMARGLLFILITVQDDLSAYTVFETLNARGLELSTTDLLKNYLFSRMASSSDLAHLQRRWRALVSITTQERFPEFLRYHMLCSHRKIRKERLFKIVRNEVKSGSDVLSLLDQLERRAEVFAAISDHTHSFWNERDQAKPYIKELRLFRVRQMTPLIFAAFDKLDTNTFCQVMRMLSIVSFRYSVVSALNTNELEPVYSDAAKAVLDGSARSASQIFAKLRAIYVSDEKFRQDFAELSSENSGARKKITKYILIKLEDKASGKALNYETDPATIEHVLPENPSSGWNDEVPRDKWDTYIYRLGNLTPLEATINRNIGQSDYQAKVSEYPKSKYRLTQEIPDLAPESWGIPQIEARQERLADLAVQIWRCDY